MRARKHREDKPFALMAPSAEVALELVELDDDAGALLTSRERPIVLAPRRPDTTVAPSVAPSSRELGVMLPYSPLHHLLLDDSGAVLVMTSANVSDEPIAYRDEDALERLAGIADLFLMHDRPIETRTDDSVLRVVAKRPLFLRRSRGYVPRDLPLDTPGRPSPAGPELKNTFCIAKGGRAWVGHHIGDLENYETLRSFTEGIEHFESLFAVRPELVAYDLHPEYLSTKYALEQEGVETIGVQHHHAHLSRVSGGARGPRSGDRGDLRRDRLRHGRDGMGRGAPAGAMPAASRGGGDSTPCGCREESAPFASRGGWPVPGSSRPRAVSRRFHRCSAGLSPRMPGGRCRSWRQAGWRRP